MSRGERRRRRWRWAILIFAVYKYGDSAEVNAIGRGPGGSVYIFRVLIESLDPDICYLIIKEFPDYLSTRE